MAYECLLYDVRDRIATLTLNRPGRLNALNDVLRHELHAALSEAASDVNVGVLVVTGAGRGFCSGGDVKAIQSETEPGNPAAPNERIAPIRDRVVMAMRECPKPIIAAVNGAAAGAGMSLALACDMRVASSAAKFSQAYVRRGLSPDWGATYFLPRLVGTAKACELMLTGNTIDAAEALRLGLVNTVVQPDELMAKTLDLARVLAEGPPIALQLTKRAIYESEQADLRAALDFESFAQTITLDTEDAREGVRAFVEKRPAQFRGR